MGKHALEYLPICSAKIHPFDAIYMEKGDAEAKGVRDILLEPNIIYMLLLLAEVLAPINLFSKFLQTGTLIYNSVSDKLNHLLDHLTRIKEELQNHDSLKQV